MVNARRLIRKSLQAVAYACFLILSVWALLEWAFRGQWIDFYGAERRALNPGWAGGATLPEGWPRILAIGDSFSAQPFSYVDVLREKWPQAIILNAAVPGIGIREAALIARRNLRLFKPDILVYQIYTGNDLWDIRKTYEGAQLSSLRKYYWLLSDYSLFLRYANYKTAQFRHTRTAQELKTEQAFSKDLYAQREKLLLQAEPDLIRNSVLLEGRRGEDMRFWLRQMDAILAELPESTRVVLLVTPHCAQVNAFYENNMRAIGAAPAALEAREYPFLSRIRAYYAADARVKVYSPLPLFQMRDTAGARLYYENDPHLNERGHRLLGEDLYAFLARHFQKLR